MVIEDEVLAEEASPLTQRAFLEIRIVFKTTFYHTYLFKTFAHSRYWKLLLPTSY